MDTFLVQLLPAVIFILSLSVPLGIALWIRHQRKHRRNPLTAQMLRAPGESISKRIDQLSEDVDLYLTFSSIVPLLCYSGFLTTRYIANSKVSPLIFVVLALGSLAYFGGRLNTAIRQRHNEQLGLDCERAVGQELNQLMLDGYRVFHDFPADGFNIDHIVVGESGVFAVETKGRGKPVKGNVNIVYDGEGLQFHTHYEKEPLAQARRQAGWLAKWLTSAVGVQVSTRPVLVFPGWYIERKKPGLLIYNGKNPQAVYKIPGEISLSVEMIQRIAHQLDQRCRDVEPSAYQRK